MAESIAGILIPDSAMAQAATDLIGQCEPGLLFRHSLRVFLFAAVIGNHKQLVFDMELLYVCSLFHDIGLTSRYRHSQLRFEVDSADAARDFLSGYAIPQRDVSEAWEAIALHTSFRIAEHMSPLIALVAAGIEIDLFGMHLNRFKRTELDEILAGYPRDVRFKEKIIDAIAQGVVHRPASVFGTVQADVLERVDPDYRRTNFCGLVLGSAWED